MITTMDTRSYTSSTTTATTGRNEFAMPGKKERMRKKMIYGFFDKQKKDKKKELFVFIHNLQDIYR